MTSAAVATDLEQENPLIEGLERLPVRPTALVIFGATGDLAHRKLLPALYNLAHEGALPERFELIGVARSDMTDEGFREMARESIERFSRRRPDDRVLDGLLAEMRYVAGRVRRRHGLQRARAKRSPSSTSGRARRSTASSTYRPRRSSSR